MLNAEYLTKTQFVVPDHKESLVRLALSESGINHEVVPPVESTIPYLGFSVYSVDADKTARILANAKIRVAAVRGDVCGDFDEVERAPVIAYGLTMPSNYGSLYNKLPVKASIQDGDILNVAELSVNDGDIDSGRWNSITG